MRLARRNALQGQTTASKEKRIGNNCNEKWKTSPPPTPRLPIMSVVVCAATARLGKAQFQDNGQPLQGLADRINVLEKAQGLGLFLLLSLQRFMNNPE